MRASRLYPPAVAAGVLLLTAFLVPRAFPHCQIPCGIYDDEARFTAMAEHITTIEKSMKSITQLAAEQPSNMNQLVRWIQNKEMHADELSHIVTYYFMTQRVKPADENDSKAYTEYTKKLALLHQMLFYTMKAKQTTDLSNIEKLRDLLEKFRVVYLGPNAGQHTHPQ